MKQLEVRVRSERVDEVVRLADRHHAFTPTYYPVESGGEAGWHQIVVNVPNDQVGPLVAAVGAAVDEAEFVVPASENLPIQTPLGDIRDQVRDVSARSTLELVLDVLQSVGSWNGLLLYAVVSGLIAAYGVIFGLPFLLTAAMLIAPVGAPAMVCVVAITLGDVWMLRHGALRFLVSIVVLAAAGVALGLAYGLTDSTGMMETLTNLSVWSALLGVAGGAAGAQALIQAERDSLVTATATGFLVAVSLSPPSAVLGLAVAIGRWDYVALMAFLIVLTFTGILVGGWAALRLRGVRPGQPSAGRGRRMAGRAMVAAAALLLAGLVAWQSQREPMYQKADMVRSATQLARDGVATVPGYRVLTATARFTTGADGWEPGEALLLTVVVAESPDGATSSDGPEEALREAIRQRVLTSMEGVTPYVDLSIVP